MLGLLAQRFLFGVATLWVVSVLVFGATQLLPGDVASEMLGQEATEEAKQTIRRQLGLDRPAWLRYGEWLGDVARGRLGLSLASRRPIAELLADRLGNTLTLVVATALFAVPLSVGLGLVCAAYPNGRLDRLISHISLVLISVPDFFIGAVLVVVFAVSLGLFPAVASLPEGATAGQLARALVLPVLTLTAAMSAHMSRMTRAAVLSVLRAPYVEMALLTGAPRRRLILVHALPNALGPIANVVALNLGYLVTGVVVVETVFAFPGLGRLMVDSVTARDVTTVQAVALIFAAAYVGLNLAADVAAILANPRLRFPA
jgi:peptide/nickel transport system permease protein